MADVRREKMLIAGKWVDAADGGYFQSICPANKKVVARVPAGKAVDVDRAVVAARKALHGPWSSLEGVQRGRLIRRVGELMIRHKEDLALRDTQDMGKPLTDARGDVEAAAAFFEFYGGLADKIYGVVNPTACNFLNYTLREPVGVVGAITPWNFPVWMAAIKLAPALACGCAVVLKPAEQSPSSALQLARLCQEAGIPEGVVNVVTGDGPGAGAPLACHTGVDHVSFTGSSAVGKHVAQMAASHLAGATCELGGKTPNVIFADAPREAALTQAIHIICRNSGQICVAGSRLLVEESIKDELLSAFTARASRLKVGDPMDPDTRMGPIVSEEQFDRVMRYIDAGQKEGARLVMGGTPLEGPSLKSRLYIGPTVFDAVEPRMTIAQDEIFGPVVGVMTFRDEDEAVELANNTRFGLAAWIWTDNVRRAHSLARRIHAGLVMVNQSGGVWPQAPYSGFKDSGMGAECGIEGAIGSYTRIKNVSIRLDAEPLDWVPRA